MTTRLVHRTFFICSTLFIACATTPPIEQPVAETESEAERACVAAVKRAGESLQSETIQQCDSDLDCRQVSGVITGSCETFVNERAFLEERAAVHERIAACRSVTQLVPACPRLRAVCRARRCVGEAVSELPDQCAEGKQALLAAATSHRECQNDGECTTVLGAAANTHWVQSVLPTREALASSCGTVSEPLFAVPGRGTSRAPNEPLAVCTTNRCEVLTEKSRFTTTVREEEKTVPAEMPVACIIDSIRRALRRSELNFTIEFVGTIEKSGRINQFEFITPDRLTVAAKRAIAARIHDCEFGPATRGGRAVDWRQHFRVDLKPR